MDDEVDQLQELDLQVEFNNNKKDKRHVKAAEEAQRSEGKHATKGQQAQKQLANKFYIRNLSDINVNLIHLFSEGQYPLGSMNFFIDRLQDSSVQGAANVQSAP